jgi:hypothetical protein
LVDVAHQNDGQVELRPRPYFVRRRRPLIGNHSRVDVLPAKSRPLGIGEDVSGFDAQSRCVIPARLRIVSPIP